MGRHVEPSWDAPLDGETYLREVPSAATIKGMFPASIATEAKRRGITLTRASQRYLSFLDYPLSGHMDLMLEAVGVFFPEVSTRRGLRKLGRAAIKTYMQTTIGKAMLGGLMREDTIARAMTGLVRAYAVSFGHPTPQVELRDERESSCLLRLTDSWIFLDSHQVGIVEGLCLACNVRPEVTLWTEGLSRGELFVSWQPAESGPRSSRRP